MDGRELSEAMDDDIRKTLADINSRAEPDAQIPVEEPDAAEPAAEPVAGQDKPRDQKSGQFKKGEQQRHQPAKTAKPSAAQAEPPTPTAAAPVAEPAAAEPSEPALKFGAVEIDLKRPPSSWKPGAKAQWNALPEDVRKEVYRREADFSNSVLNGPMKQNADFGNAVRQTVEPYRAMIESEGGTPERAIGELFKTAALFRTGSQPSKLNALFALDQQFNAGLRDHFTRSVQAEVARLTGGAAPQQQQPQQQQVFQDPRVDTIMQSLQAQERLRAQQEENVANSATDQFLASKNDKGEPKFPFVDNVIDDMTNRVALIRQQNPAAAHNDVLQRAYDEAVWANPETRAVLIAQTQAPVAAAAQTAQKVAAAKRATVGAMPKRGAIPATDPPKSLEDTIRETAQGLGMF